MTSTNGGWSPRFTTGRRAMLMGLTALATSAVGPRMARAATAPLKGRKLVFASWGGAYQEAQKASYCDPFAAASQVEIMQDGPMNEAKLRTMIEQDAVVWDVCDVGDIFLFDAASRGMLEKIDDQVVDRSRVDPRYMSDYGVGCIVWSYNIAYNTKAVQEGEHPRSWADLFDLERFPGRRMLSRDLNSNLEIALLADGVPADRLYPLDVERALRKLDTIKEQVIWWQTNSQSQQLLVDGEVRFGVMTNGRVFDAVKKGAPLGIEWNQNIQSVAYLVVPRNAKNADVAMHLLDYVTHPEPQAQLANMIAYSPTNLDAVKYIRADVTPWLCTAPENLRNGVLSDAQWWAGRVEPITKRWEEWRLS